MRRLLYLLVLLISVACADAQPMPPPPDGWRIVSDTQMSTIGKKGRVIIHRHDPSGMCLMIIYGNWSPVAVEVSDPEAKHWWCEK